MTSSFRLRAVLVCLLTFVTLQPLSAGDYLHDLQARAVVEDRADWGHWGTDPTRYSTWSSHSNRLVPVYTFGVSLDTYQGENSVYRDAERLKKLYSRTPTGTLNPTAEYFDQTDLYHLQKQAVADGKKYIFVVVFDGLDWVVTRAAATYYSRGVKYDEGRGIGLYFQDYRGAATDYGFCVTSPHNEGTDVDVDGQVILNPGGKIPGGYDARLGGQTPWDTHVDLAYLIGQNRQQSHAFTDSAPSAGSIVTGAKMYNGSINVDPHGQQLVPLPRELQQQGFGVGVVTSVPISHATPAAAYANNVSRDDFQDLTRDLLGQRSIAHRQEPLPGVDVLLGTGWGVEKSSDPDQGQNFVPGPQYFTLQSLAEADVRQGGKYHVVTRQAGVVGKTALARAASEAAESGQRLLGIFGVSDGNLPYATADGDYHPAIIPHELRDKLYPKRVASNPDHHYSPAEVSENPTLAELTTAALTVLEKKDRFWLTVEAGDVDWAAHGNNLDAAIGAVKSGDDAFRAIVQWIEARDAWDESAVIVTADHGHLLVLNQPEKLIPPVAPPVVAPSPAGAGEPQAAVAR